MFLREDPHIGLFCRLPLALPARGYTKIKKIPERRVNTRADRADLVPDGVAIQRGAEMVRELLADSVPVGFCNGIVLLIVKPDRAGMQPYQVRDRNILSWFRQDDSSIKRGKLTGLYLLHCIPCRVADSHLFIPVPPTGTYVKPGNLGQYPANA